MPETLKLEVMGSGDQWQRIDSDVAGFGERVGWPPTLDFKIRLMLEELILNAVDYGTRDKSTVINLHIHSSDDEVSIELSDNGRCFNPLEDAPEPDLDSDLEDRPLGGLGLYLVKKMADEIGYERVDGLNKLSITTRRTE